MRLVLAAAGVPLALMLAAAPAALLAQDEDGGLRLSFGLTAGVERVTNPGLDVPAADDRTAAYARLSFGLADATRATSVDLRAAGTLQGGSGELDRGLINPSLRLALGRTGPGQSLRFTSFLTETDLDTLRSLVLDPETGEVVEDAEGEGTRRQTGADLVYGFGEGGPWGGTLSAGFTDTTFSGDTTEPDTQRLRAGATLRFALDPATDVTGGLRWSRFENDTETRDTLRADAGIARALPAGSISAGVFAERTEDGTRTGLTFGRSYELPDGALSLSLGLTRDTGGGLRGTGALSWTRELPRGSLRASLRQQVAAGDDDEETQLTAIDLGFSQQLTPAARLDLGLTASTREDTATGITTRNAALSATYLHDLPQDWALAAGWRHRIRDRDTEGRATSDTLFLELRRAVELRP
jgi:hypothetical protein